MSQHATEVERGERFGFGENWTRFLSVLDDARVEEAKTSLRRMLNVESLKGRTFVDVGSGSGLFSLAARLLGAKVHSFDFDPSSVACTAELKRRYFADDMSWTVEPGSVLDKKFLSGLGKFDVVYSWGVLHHTGRMWEALENVTSLVKENGYLFISIYNDQGGPTRRWKVLKRAYNKNALMRKPLVAYTLARQWTLTLVRDLLHGHPFSSWRNYKTARGMSAWHDVVDWIGGYPFEVARPEEIFEFYRSAGFTLQKLKTCGGGLGCNEFVFRKD